MKRLAESRGASLIEVTLILVILVFLAAVVGLNLSSFAQSKVNSAARKLASDIRFAQQMAISRQNRHGVAFNTPAANQYTVYEQDDPLNPARNPDGGNDFIINFTTGTFAGVTMTSTFAMDGGGRRLVKFDSRGEPFDGANTAVGVPNNTVTLSYQGSNAVVTVGAVTGRVTY